MKPIKIVGQNFHFLEIMALLAPILFSIAILIGSGFKASMVIFFAGLAFWVILVVLIRTISYPYGNEKPYWDKES